MELFQNLGDKISGKAWPLDATTLCEQATKATGLQDFGSPPIEPALTALTASLREEASLHPLGRFLMYAHLRGLLQTRLQLHEYWREQGPSNFVFERPLFITGMPRSGSTFLQELLAQDPRNRSPRVWQVMSPLPGRRTMSWLGDSRVLKASASLWCFRKLAPLADSVHPLRAQTPHECVAIHSYTLLSEEFVTTCNVPSYEEFLHNADLSCAYRWQKRFLAHLQSDNANDQWVLKSPDHVRSFEHLFNVFPDAIIVQTHRDPVKVLESCVRLVAVLQRVFSDNVDTERLIARETRALAEAIDLSIEFRERHPELADRFVDINYSDLVSDPLAAVRRIYRLLGRPLTEDAENRMSQLAAGRGRYKWKGAAPSRPPPPVLSGQIPAFAQYCYKFGLISESK